jgi:predicted Fe-Mo cluster-binding NifX family protein
MKITIPMNEQKLESGICPSFGRAPYFLLYDTDINESKWIPNSAAESSGGAGIAAAQLIADSGADSLITPRCGENAEKVLSGAKIKVYRSIEGTAKENLIALTAGKLSPLSEFHAGFHGHGG